MLKITSHNTIRNCYPILLVKQLNPSCLTDQCHIRITEDFWTYSAGDIFINAQRFGGPWTEQKLNALGHYLSAYLAIFTRNAKAARFTRHYVDAFAGSGLRIVGDTRTKALELGEFGEALDYIDGSVRKVLSMDVEFHQY